MNKIINAEKASEASAYEKSLNKKVVLVGGSFDILHKGHLNFLQKASENGDVLFVLLESDENIKKKKGKSRPINSKNKRALVLSTLPYIDYVIALVGVTKDEDYDKLIVQIEPDFIALTKGDSQMKKRGQQSNSVGAKLVVIDKINTPSTTDLAKEIKY